MGKRDFAKREARKPKKDAKKLPPTNIIEPTAEVEVIRKGKKPREGEEEE